MAKTAREKSGGSSIVARARRLFAEYARHWGVVLLTIFMVVLGSAMRGDVIFVAVLAYKSYLANFRRESVDTQNITTDNANGNRTTRLTVARSISGESIMYSYEPMLPDYLQIFPDEWNMKDALFYIAMGVGSSQLIFQILSGFLQWYYYIRQRNNPQDWKCQPKRFLTWPNELHQFIVGTVNMTAASTISGCIVCWVVNGNYNTLYFRLDQYGYPYFFFSFFVSYVWLEGASYYYHVFLHIPFVYRNVHKHHHRYHSPTAYCAVAMSPIELLLFEVLIFIPPFLYPINAVPFITILLYANYFGIIDHSGIKMESWFPWQPNSLFHDDHHKYFHVNFGFNSYFLTGFTERCDGKTGYMAKTSLVAEEKRKNLKNPE